MTVACSAPDEGLGVALRLSSYLDCQARALGQNGFEAFAGGPIVSGLLSGAITVFVALIGYRLLLGLLPTLRDGFGWAMRVGLVLALTTGWPAFQTLVYNVVTEGPVDLATALLPAIGLPATDPGQRVQDAYEIIGHGMSAETTAQASPAVSQQAATTPVQGDPQATIVSFVPSPVAASLLVASTIGVIAALRLAAGFLVAIGPLAVIGLLFDNTVGLVAGWIRAMTGAALGVVGVSITSMLEIAVVESEIARIRDAQAGLLPPSAPDSAAFATIVAVFGLIALIVVFASFRAAAGLRLSFKPGAYVSADSAVLSGRSAAERGRAGLSSAQDGGSATTGPMRTRASAVSDALVLATQRDTMIRSSSMVAPIANPAWSGNLANEAWSGPLPGSGRRRTNIRRTRLAARRDRSA